MYIKFHLDILTTVVLVLDWKKQCKDDCFRDVAVVLEYSREYILSKLDITEHTMQNLIRSSYTW